MKGMILMIRKIIKIDEDKCIGCSLCATACHEGAIKMVNGKAKLIRDDYCDGLGDCLPVCPTDAISFIEREALAYDEKAVLNAKNANKWPIQLKLIPSKTNNLDGKDLLIAASCSAFTYPRFHQELIGAKRMVIACPKLDNEDYSYRLSELFANNKIKSITIVRMEVPCCGGLTKMVRKALLISGKEIPLNIITISTNGEIINGTNH